MAKKYVIDTKAGKSISAYIILKKNKLVGKVQASFSDSGMCLVNVWDFSKSDGFQHATAGGWGYDKLTAALDGLTVDGISLNDHCATSKATEKMLAAYKADPRHTDWSYVGEVWTPKAKKIGASFANWNVGGNQDGYSSLYLDGGLDKLRTLGYTILQAI